MPYIGLIAVCNGVRTTTSLITKYIYIYRVYLTYKNLVIRHVGHNQSQNFAYMLVFS